MAPGLNVIPIPNELNEYAFLHSVREDPLLHELAVYTREHAPLPEMLSGHVECALFRLLIQATAARRVLEIGTYTGYSALSMAMGLPEDGELITCDVDPDVTAIAENFWARSPHGRKIRLHLGPAAQTLEALDGPFDFAFVDADKSGYVAYWDAILPMLRKNALIAVDNVLWSGRVLDPKEQDDHAIVAFNRHARYDDRVELVMLTIRDGITLARKR